MEKGKEYYNKLYKGLSNYMCDYKKSPYYIMWIHVLSLIGNEKIFEGGCGTGQFAKMLIDNKKNYHLGIDYSEEAIEIAKEINPENEDIFILWDLFKFDELEIDYDLFLSLEVLEHIDNDLGLLKKIKKGKRVIVSVPNFNDPAHVRIFKNERKVRVRYEKLIEIKTIQTYQFPSSTSKIFIVDGIKK